VSDTASSRDNPPLVGPLAIQQADARAPIRRYGSGMLDRGAGDLLDRALDRVVGWVGSLQRRWLNQSTLDSAMAFALGTAAVLGHLFPRLWPIRPDIPTGLSPIDAIGVALALLQTVPIVSRRRAPMAVLAITGIATVARSALGFDSSIGAAAVLVAVYSVAAHTDRRSSVIALGVTLVALGVAIFLSRDQTVGIEAYLANLLLYATAWLVGDNRRVRRAYTRELEARAERLERDRVAEAARAVADERGRIARELHDIVTHSVTVMTVQAAAARRVVGASPRDAEQALASIETTGRDALAEMRRLLGVLRTDDSADDDLAPQPGLDRIGELVAQLEASGLPVHFEVEGDRRSLPSGVDLAAYRIVQEALTNSLKHAGKARAEVRLRFAPDALHVHVADDGRGAAAPLTQDPATRDSGHGLIGMRERVALYGGELTAGPRPDGGYAVDARIPLDGTLT